MLVLLLAAVANAETGGLDNLPADPVRAWAVILTTLALPVLALATAKVSSKKTAANEAKSPTPSVVINGSVTPHIDASQQLLAKVVGDLQAECDELKQLQLQNVRAIARFELKVEQLEARVRELEVENNVLRMRTGPL